MPLCINPATVLSWQMPVFPLSENHRYQKQIRGRLWDIFHLCFQYCHIDHIGCAFVSLAPRAIKLFCCPLQKGSVLDDLHSHKQLAVHMTP